MTTAREDRTFGWWVSVFLTPVGIIGGPIAIADMLAGVIEWHGPFGYVVEFWDEHISASFGKLLAAALEWISIPSPPEYVVDYLTLGVLFFAGSIRSRGLTVSRKEAQYMRYQGNWFVGVLLRGIQIIWVVLAWPLIATLFLLWLLGYAWARWRGNFISFKFDVRRFQFSPDQRALITSVALAPFAIFLVLWLANSAWGR